MDRSVVWLERFELLGEPEGRGSVARFALVRDERRERVAVVRMALDHRLELVQRGGLVARVVERDRVDVAVARAVRIEARCGTERCVGVLGAAADAVGVMSRLGAGSGGSAGDALGSAFDRELGSGVLQAAIASSSVDILVVSPILVRGAGSGTCDAVRIAR